MNNKLLSYLTLIIIVYSCKENKSDKYNCNVKNKYIVYNYYDSLLSQDTSNEQWLDRVNNYEKSIGSTILFDIHSNNITDFNPYKDSLLNEKDRAYRERNTSTDFCGGCFLGFGIRTYIVALRPQVHPFIKEIAIYGGDFSINNEYGYSTYYYYRNRTLDQLIPPKIYAQYQKDSFSIDEFWCYRDQLLEALDEYHGVGEPKTRCYVENEKPKGKKERFIYNRDMNIITDIIRQNFSGTDEDYKWLKQNKSKMKCYGWYTAFGQPYTNKLYINTFWYDNYFGTKSTSSSKDVYMQLQLTYRKDYVDKIIYK